MPDLKARIPVLEADHAQLYDILISHLTDFAVFLMDQHGCIASWNPGVERLLGYSESDWVGQTVSVIFTPEDQARGMAEQEIAKAAKTGQSPDVRWHLRKDGTRLYVEGTLVALRDKANKLLGFSKMMRDITDRKRTEEALEKSEKQLRMVMDAAPAIISYVDRNLRYRLANNAYERWFGIAPDDLVGKTVFELFGGALIPSIQPNFEKALNGETVCFEEDYPSKSGENLRLQVTYTPDFDQQGQVQGFMVLGSDTTARKAAERALQESERRQEALVLLGDRLRDLKDVASLTLAAMEIAGKTLGVARAGYGVVDATQEYVTIENDWRNDGVVTLAGTYRFKDFGDHLEERLRRGDTIVISDVSTDPITANGSERWKAIHVGALINLPLIENGRLVAILFIQHSSSRAWTEADLTFIRKVADRTWAAIERARTLKELQESEEFNRSVLASTPDCVKVMDLQGRLLTMNEGGCRQMEIDDFRSCVNQPWADFWGEGKYQAEQSITRAREGRTTRFEGLCHTAKGTPKWWEVVVTPVLDASGQAVRILSLARDITERIAAEKERDRLTGDLKRSNEELSQFAHTVAHDLQSPLRGVMSFAQLLVRKAQGQLGAEELQCVNHIVENARRMQELVKAVLGFAQVGQGEIEKKPVEMEGVADAVLQSLQTHIQEQEAEITRDVLPLVSGDSIQLSQLLQNLVANALKYCRADKRPDIKIGVVRKGGQFVFAVEDNGVGIEAQHLQQIFEPLKRLHGPDLPGTGLGLAICQRIVNRHGGRIWVESTPGAGSTFYFTLEGA